MKVNFKDYDRNYCKHCKNHGTDKCNHCITANGYIAKPSMFESEDEIVNQYFNLLHDYSKMLYCMGFEVESN